MLIETIRFSRFLFAFVFHTVSSNGALVYNEVNGFLENQPNMIIQCKSISTEHESLTLTRNHLVYARKTSVGQFNPV